MKKIILNSEQETIELGKKFASRLEKGDVIVLTGELRVRKNQIYRRSIDLFRFAKRNI